ncbi:MAG: hypothetical protein HYX65_09065 [Gemmatimonadetes bacterium]|nr:hypothetical protein [Gemmatimonadota bacterium]
MRPSLRLLIPALLAGCGSGATVRTATPSGRAGADSAARSALQAERALGGRPRGALTVGVLPFESADSSVDDLSYGFAELVQADLGTLGGIRLVERLQMDELMKEQSLDTARTDLATRARTGRLVAAGQLVHGRMAASGDTAVQFDVALLNVETSAVGTSLAGTARADALFEAERRVVAKLAVALGIEVPRELELAQRARNAYPAEAFRAFSAGARAEASGDLETASTQYSLAVAAAPGFAVAEGKARSVRQQAAGQARKAVQKVVPRRPAVRRPSPPARIPQAASAARTP